MTIQLDEGLSMARFAYYGISTAEDEEEAERMITAKTPGAYIMDKGGKARGYANRITKERVEELRAQGIPLADIAAILGVSYSALQAKRYRWKRQESKNTPEGQR